MGRGNGSARDRRRMREEERRERRERRDNGRLKYLISQGPAG